MPDNTNAISSYQPSTFASTNPATGEEIGVYGVSTAAEVRAAISVAKGAQARWAREPIGRRLAVLKKFQHILASRKEHVARLISIEAGKPIVEAATSEILVTLDSARFVCENTYKVLREERVEHGSVAMKPKRGRLIFAPVGVVGIIAPWNYPFSIPAVDTLAALALGNGVVLKPSELTPACGMELQSLLIESGLPAGLLQVVNGFGETGAALITGGVDKIIFTGSVATGKRVGMACAEGLVPCVLELGGKDAMIILEDADVDVASSAAVWGSMMNTGQTCISVERCFVHHGIYDKFVDACVDKVRKLRVGNGQASHTDVGPMISSRQLEIVERQVLSAIENGAHAVCGGHRLPDLGANFFAPTVMTDVGPSTSLWCEETFGPVLPITSFENADEAVSRANDSSFGLAASVWSNDRKKAEWVARRLNAGAITVNDLLVSFGISEAPHGGVKASGIGRTHGLLGMRELVQPKYIAVDTLPQMKQMWWFNYTPELKMQMMGFIDLLFAGKMETRLRGALNSAGAILRKRL